MMDKRFKTLIKEIEDYLPQSPFWEKNPNDVLIYGTGTMARDICKVLIARGIPVKGFLDHRAGTSILEGLPVWNPDSQKMSFDQRGIVNIVIGIHNPFADLPAIYNQLNTLGYKHIINPIQLNDYLFSEMGTRYWLTDRSFYKSLGPILEKVYNLWSDERSRDIFTAILEHRITGDYSHLPEVDWDHRYAPLDIPQWKNPVRLIDCGAFDGDSILDIKKAGIEFEAIAAFEPDSNSYRKLINFFETKRDLCKNITLWPCGVYSSTSQMGFSTHQEAKSNNLFDIGKHTIQCIAIDDALPTFAPTLIKMDIEAAEYDALIGAQKIICQYNPGLAISVYHRPEHLWQIPLFIENLTNSSITENTKRFNTRHKYDYFLRSHQMNGYELVFYAIPTG